MKNTFRYSLSRQDYIAFEKMKTKLNTIRPVIFLAFFALAFCIYWYVSTKDLVFLVCTLVLFAIYICSVAYKYYISSKKAVDKYLSLDDGYLKSAEFSVDSYGIESRGLPEENESMVITAYPYSIMNAIYETEDYFYFFVGFEVKILPKSAVPPQMQATVFGQIKKNTNCVFVK